MGQISVYLPEDLRRRVKKAKLSVSAICQEALRAELGDDVERDDLEEWQLAVRDLDDARKILRTAAILIEREHGVER